MSNTMISGQSGFDFFGSFGSNLNAEPVVMEVKKEEKKEKKTNKSSSTPAKKSSTTAKVEGPVNIIGSGWTYTYGEEGKTYGIMVVAKALYDAGYTEVAATGAIYTVEDDPHLLIVRGIGCARNDDSEVIPAKIDVVTGLVKATYEAKDFAGKDAEEVSVRDLCEKYVEAYPDFKGCQLILNRAAAVAVPAFTRKADIKDEQTYRVWSTLETVEVKGSELKGLYGGSGYEVTFYISDAGVLFPSYTSKKSHMVSEADLGLKKEASKKAVEKYSLPATIYIQTLGESISATPEMFGGKDKVMQKDILEFLKSRHPVFSQGDRKFDLVYDDVSNIISVAILSGKKGAAAIGAASFFYTEGEEVVQDLPLGTFKGTVRDGRLRDISFDMKLPKFPLELLKGIVADFAADLTSEDIRMIIWDEELEKYDVVRPESVCTKTGVDYMFPPLSKGQILAMTIHSHNTMPAFFSGTDNEDEVLTGLYGVVGDLGRSPKARFRASLNGSFAYVKGAELFEVGGAR